MSERAERFERSWGEFCEAFERDDPDRGLAALQAWILAWDECVQARDTDPFEVAYHDDVHIVNRLPLPGLSDSDGLAKFRQTIEEIPDVINRFRFEVQSYERRDDRFLGRGIFRARGRYSGLVMRIPLAVLWTYRDGKISRVEAFASRRRARLELMNAEAVG